MTTQFSPPDAGTLGARGRSPSPQQVRLVQASWQRVLPIRERAAELFYARLFERQPALRPLFHGDLARQGEKLMAALDFVVRGLDRGGEMLPAVQQLARRHVGYGVQPAHYDAVGEALTWTLAQGLGEAATDEVLQAWATAYASLAAAMKRAAWPPPPQGPEWQAQAS